MSHRLALACATSLLFAFAACSDDGDTTTTVPGPDSGAKDSGASKDGAVADGSIGADAEPASDAATTDASGSTDASPADGGSTDAATEGGASDASADGASTDAGADAGKDGGSSDASVMDSSVADSSVADSSVVDSGPNCPSSILNGTLATFDFTGEPGNQVSTPAKSSAAGLTTGSISRSSNVKAQSGSNSINSYDWALTQTPDMTKYYTFTLTPDPRCKLSLSGLSIDTQASGTGPAKASVATSDDSYVAMSAITPNSVSTPSLSVVSTAKAIEVRVYGYAAGGDAGSTGGTFRVQTTLTIKGSLQ